MLKIVRNATKMHFATSNRKLMGPVRVPSLTHIFLLFQCGCHEVLYFPTFSNDDTNIDCHLNCGAFPVYTIPRVWSLSAGTYLPYAFYILAPPKIERHEGHTRPKNYKLESSMHDV